MDFLGIFDGSKPFKKIPIPITSARHRVPPSGMSGLDSLLNESHCSVVTSGTDYVEEYVQEEEQRLLAEAAIPPLAHLVSGDHFEAVSLVTSTSNHRETNNEKPSNIYKTYNFDRRPKDNLTITSSEEKIVSMIETNKVIVIQGPTGCGKTTQVPQFILDSCCRKRIHCNIIVTQPRRIAAISIAKRVCQERGWPVGSLVGYQVGMVNNTSQDTRLTYCTTGVLLQKLISVKNMNDYTHVIIDEVHERDQDMDFLLLVVRKLQRSNSRDVRVILMSATFNVDKFSNYFSSPLNGKLVAAPIVDITKCTNYKVQVNYLCELMSLGRLPTVSADKPHVSPEMMTFCESILYVLDDIDENTERRHAVLIFLPGIWEIEEMHDILTREDKARLKWDVVVLHSSITNDEQQRIFEFPPTGHRRIILATNIAESSITVLDVKFVIDFCLTKQLVTDPKTNYQCLELGWASKANCEQRAGRTGRLMDGRVYRLVPQHFYEKVLREDVIPEILRAPLENVVLKTKMLEMGEPKAILALAMDPPVLSNLERTILLLKETGALLNKNDDEISPYDGDLTDLGRVMAQLPVDIRIAKLIALGHAFSVLRESTIIGASMAVKNMFSNPFRSKLQAYTSKLAWSEHSNSDCIAFLNVYNMWMLEKGNQRLRDDRMEKKWAKRKFLQIRVLREIDAMVHDMTGRLRNIGIRETIGPNRVGWTDAEKPVVIKIVVAGAFYPNYYTRSVNLDDKAGVRILGGLDPTKTVYLQGWPVNQPGPLYARQIQNCFVDCVNSNVAKILVTFDQSSRVYVEFRKNESPDDDENFIEDDEPGEISMSVYKAVKLRSFDDSPMEIRLMDSESANRRAEELGIRHSIPKLLLPKNEISSRVIKESSVGIRPVLPGLDISCIPLIVRRIVTPGHFWAQIRDDENAARLRNIHEMINSPDSRHLTKLNETPEIGSLVLAPHRSENSTTYHRAIVQKITIETTTELLAKLLFVDYGYVDRVRVNDLRRINDSVIAKIPALAFECVLAGIRPSVTTTRSRLWSQEATKEFHKLLDGNVSLYGEIYSVVSSVVYLKLVRFDGKEQMEINEHFVKSGYAVTREESYLSRSNHELRDNYLTMSLRQRQHHEEMQYDQVRESDLYPDIPITDLGTSKVTLQGPYSPLEIDVTSLTNAGLGKRVHIDRTSVNSVLLDVNPDDPHHCLLVAGHVTQNSSGNNLNLRNTTLMPNISGLTSIICLLFAPRIELRRNSTGTRYSGALCGLGYHPITKNTLFHDHDLSVFFDVDITMNDLQDINRLRHWISMGIRTNAWGETEDDDTNQIAYCQNRVKTILFDLLAKKRKPIETREIDPNFGRWCRYDESLYIPPGKVVTSKRNIFDLHSAIDLNEKDDERDTMINHILELRELSTRHYRDRSVMDVVCKLCNVNITGVFDLRKHLHTSDHKYTEMKYHPLPK